MDSAATHVRAHRPRGQSSPGRATGAGPSACHYGAVAHSSASAGALLRHVRTGRAHSRADLVALTGASRNTVSARVDQLIAANLLEEGGRGWSTGGRPPTLLQFNSRAGCVLAVDLGVPSVDVAVTDLSAQIRSEERRVGKECRSLLPRDHRKTS